MTKTQIFLLTMALGSAALYGALWEIDLYVYALGVMAGSCLAALGVAAAVFVLLRRTAAGQRRWPECTLLAAIGVVHAVAWNCLLGIHWGC